MLSRRWVINCVLIVLIAGLTWVSLRLDEKSSGDKEPRISKLAPAEVDRIEILSGESRLMLKRDAGSWNIEEPISWPALDANVARLLSILNVESSPLAQTADVDLKALGLDPPGTRLRFNDNLLQFGAVNNIGERRYLMIDSKLYLLPDIYLAFVGQGLAGLVDRRLLPRRYRIERIQLPEFEIERGDDDGWRSPRNPDFSPLQLQQLIDNWQELQASRIRTFERAIDSGERIEIRLTDGRVLEYLLLSSTPEIVIANPQIGLQYHFRADYYDQLISIRGDNDS